MRRIRMPRRHDARRALPHDRLRPRPNLGVGDERHGRDLTCAMALDAIGIEDWRDVVRERRRAGPGCRCLRARIDGYSSNEREYSDEEKRVVSHRRAAFGGPEGPPLPFCKRERRVDTSKGDIL